MCGIAGLMGTFEKSIGEESTKKMLKEIIHRGPDSNGVWSTDNFSFGMQRLSIVDLQSGEQPIWIDSGIGIVFNGEIYNHKEIRSSLEKKGLFLIQILIQKLFHSFILKMELMPFMN